MISKPFIAKIKYSEKYYMSDYTEEFTDTRIVIADSKEQAWEKVENHPDYQSVDYELYRSIISLEIFEPIE